MKSDYDSWLIQKADEYWSKRLQSDKPNSDSTDSTEINHRKTADYYRRLSAQMLKQQQNQ